jgi:uncharacterized membrane protein
MDDMLPIFQLRLDHMIEIVSQGVIPGQLDSVEYHQLQGSIKEMKFVIDYMQSNYKHDSDGLIYTNNPQQSKCKLCGEFYR